MGYAGRPLSVRRSWLVGAFVLGLSWFAISTFGADEPGFETLFDGKNLSGWKANEHNESWKLEGGELVCHGPRSHLFYMGSNPDRPAEWTNFHFKAEVMTKPGANSGIYFHTTYQPEGWPSQGHEAQVNNTQSDPVRTGSLYNVVKNFEAPAKDGEWFTEEVIVEGNRIRILVNGRTIVDHVEKTGEIKDGRKLSKGTFALQAHDPGSEVHYRNIRVKRLP
ncbi:MAG: DUF1080 domain-containing protein [Planctomycetaceae bacterium]